MDNIVRNAYITECNEAYSKYVLINLDKLSSIEGELMQSQQYLPVLIRRYLSQDYRKYLINNGVGDESLFNQLNDTRRLRNESAVIELQQWLQNNIQYNDLFDEKSYGNLVKELDNIEREYDKLDLW